MDARVITDLRAWLCHELREVTIPAGQLLAGLEKVHGAATYYARWCGRLVRLEGGDRHKLIVAVRAD